jgi:hypothetical protein
MTGLEVLFSPLRKAWWEYRDSGEGVLDIELDDTPCHPTAADEKEK